MSRWLVLFGCVVVVFSLAYIEPRPHGGVAVLGAACERTTDCQYGMRCAAVVEDAPEQCTASCSDAETCQEQFGSAAMCTGADACVRTCSANIDCGGDGQCNDYGWCERKSVSETATP
jgi:hypothetical protein